MVRADGNMNANYFLQAEILLPSAVVSRPIPLKGALLLSGPTSISELKQLMNVSSKDANVSIFHITCSI